MFAKRSRWSGSGANGRCLHRVCALSYRCSAATALSSRERRTMHRESGRGLLPLIAAAAVGAGIMYLLDPDRGRRRRRLLEDRLGHAARDAGALLGNSARHLANRAVGIGAETRAALIRG